MRNTWDNPGEETIADMQENNSHSVICFAAGGMRFIAREDVFRKRCVFFLQGWGAEQAHD